MANELVSINSDRTLTDLQYQQLADIPPELEWLEVAADFVIGNPPYVRLEEIAEQTAYIIRKPTRSPR